MTERIKKALILDDSLKATLAFFGNQPDSAPVSIRKKFEDFTMINGLLLYRGLIYVPNDESIKRDLVRERHDSVMASHPGRAATVELLSRDFYWPSMARFVQRYTDACDTCNRTKSMTHKPFGPLQPLQVPEAPWTDVTYDMIVDLPKSEGYDSILVVVDRFSKGAHFIPLRKDDSGAKKIASLFLEHVWRHRGTPMRTVSDRGSNFNSQFMRELYQALGIKPSFSTAYHPQTDGQTERINQILEQYLRLYTSYRQDDWVRFLPLAEFAYNNHRSASTGHSPFFVNTGRHPIMSPSLMIGSNVPAAEEYARAMHEAHEEVKASIQLAQEHHKRFYDRHVQESPNYAPKDKVWLTRAPLKTDRPSDKLDYKQIGPFEVIEKIGTSAYRLKLPFSMKIHPVFHVSRLNPVRLDTIPGRQQPPPPPIVMDDGVKEFLVEKVLDSKLKRGKLYFKVSWVGYPIDEQSWEPAENLDNAPEKIEEFYQQYPEAVRLPVSTPPRSRTSLRRRRT